MKPDELPSTKSKISPFRGLDIDSPEVTVFTEMELVELERDCENWEGVSIQDEALFALRLLKTIHHREKKLAIAVMALEMYAEKSGSRVARQALEAMNSIT